MGKKVAYLFPMHTLASKIFVMQRVTAIPPGKFTVCGCCLQALSTLWSLLTPSPYCGFKISRPNTIRPSFVIVEVATSVVFNMLIECVCELLLLRDGCLQQPAEQKTLNCGSL